MSEQLPRVLFSFPTRLGTSGIGTTAWHQVTELARLGVEVSVVAGSVERSLPGVRVLAETMRVRTLRVPYRAIGFERALAWHDHRAARIVAELRDAIDVVHAWPAGAERTLETARRHGIPALLERPNAHTAYAFSAVADECARLAIAIDPESPHAFNAGRLAHEEREYAAADGLLCPSEFVASTFRERGFSEDRLLRHHYGFDPAHFSPPLRRDGAHPFSVAFVGRGEPRKGLHTALQAWLRSGCADSGRFVIAGVIEPGYRKLLEPLLTHPSVVELGHVPEPADVMRECDALVLSSVEEGSALVTYEARASGCVLLVSDRTGALCRHEHDALVHAAGDENTLREHMTRLCGEPATLARLRDASLAGLRDLTWSAAARALLDAYGEAAKRRRAAAPAPVRAA
jgi:glycosyltransferase involved in cell wall biosynthesis